MMSCNDKLSGNEGNTRKGGGVTLSKTCKLLKGK